MKKLIGIAAGIGMLLASVAPTFAANTCDNQTTGPGSINACIRLLLKLQGVGVTNTGFLFQGQNTHANSGNNISDGNTTGGVVGSGGAAVVAGNAADLNPNTIGVVQSDPAAEDQGSNNITGPGSINIVAFATVKAARVNVANTGIVFQGINASANSGNNSASFNTTGGAVVTGDASVTSTNVAAVNSNVISISQ